MKRPAAVLILATVVLSGAAEAQPPMEALPSILHLQLSQHPAWRAYKDATAEQAAEAAHEAGQAAELNAMETPARLDALRHRLDLQRGAFERQADATAAFYAVLSPDQRRIFDDVTRLPTSTPRFAPPSRRGQAGPGLLRAPPGESLPPPPG